MAQDGDTITYTYSNNLDDDDRLIPVEEDVSSVDEMTIEYIKGAGGIEGSSGGLVEDVVVDISNHDSIYIWVASHETKGRYEGETDTNLAYDGGGSSEIAFVNTDARDSFDEPFIAGAGGGYGKRPGGDDDDYYGPGAREGERGGGVFGAEGGAPPKGGGSYTEANGAVETISEIKNTGSTTVEGGMGAGTDAEIQISYRNTPPTAPTNLSATLQ